MSHGSADAGNSLLTRLARHARLWLIPLGVLLGLLPLEGLLRLFPSLLPPDAQQRVLWTMQTPAKSVGDPYLGYVFPPYYRMEVNSPDYHFTVESDAHGFRNHWPWPDTADIVIVGDSMAYGYGVAQQEAWPALLGEALPTLRVITLAMPGAVPQQYTRYFEKFGVPLRPKLLIFTIFCGNDIIEAPIFDRWLAAGSPGNYDVWRFFEGKVPSKQTDLLERSYLLQALQSLRKGLTYGFSGTTVPLLDGGQVRLAPILYAESLRHNHPGDPGFDAVVRAAVEARERARSIDSRFVVLFVPTKELVYLPFLRAPFPGVKGPLIDVLARKKGMTIVDLTEPLREQAALGKQVYFEIDGHPNGLGNRVIADTLAKWLRENAQSLGLRALTPSDS